MAFYGTAVGFSAYHTARGRTVPVSWTTGIIEAALLVASEWLDNAYDQLWYGYAVAGYTQERKWPRTSAMTNTDPVYIFSESETPNQVLHATYEAAFREATTTGALSLDFTPQKYKSASVEGAVAVEYVTPNDVSEVQLQIPQIQSLMSALIDPQKGSSDGLSGKAVRG